MNNKLMQTHATDMILISKIFEALQKIGFSPLKPVNNGGSLGAMCKFTVQLFPLNMNGDDGFSSTFCQMVEPPILTSHQFSTAQPGFHGRTILLRPYGLFK